MGWASEYIQQLLSGETVSFRPRGDSMKGRVESGQLCTIAPIGERDPEVGDVVLCRVSGTELLHLIKGIEGDRYEIGNTRGGITGWTHRDGIFGILVRLED